MATVSDALSDVDFGDFIDALWDGGWYQYVFPFLLVYAVVFTILNYIELFEDKKPVRIMKGQYGPYIKYKSLNATIPEEKDPSELTMEEALILIEKRKEYDKTKKSKKRKSK